MTMGSSNPDTKKPNTPDCLRENLVSGGRELGARGTCSIVRRRRQGVNRTHVTVYMRKCLNVEEHREYVTILAIKN